MTNHTKSITTFNMAVIAFAMMLVGGLVVVPVAVEQVDAKCDGFKKNGEPCKPKPKDALWNILSPCCFVKHK